MTVIFLHVYGHGHARIGLKFKVTGERSKIIKVNYVCYTSIYCGVLWVYCRLVAVAACCRCDGVVGYCLARRDVRRGSYCWRYSAR